jgi:hypothetical protein|tara:strand:+ start:662 stop:868 length:207 start_codon:yes stop_codon:yes gene_type:complete
MLIDGMVKNVRTKTKAEDEGNVTHLTTVTVEFEDLDRSLLEQLAFAEKLGRYLTMELRTKQTPATIGS